MSKTCLFARMESPGLICLGASLVDEVFRFHYDPVAETSNPADIQRAPGGVARNIAHHLAQVGCKVELITHFGADAEGLWLHKECSQAGIILSHSLINSAPTGRYAAFLKPDGELITAAAVSRLETEITPRYLEAQSEVLSDASVLVADCNLALESLEWLLNFARQKSKKMVLEPVSIAKAGKLKNLDLSEVWLITPGVAEAESLGGIQHLLNQGVTHIWLRKGRLGSEWITKTERIDFPSAAAVVKDTTGAGDAALAGWLYAWASGKSFHQSVRYGHVLASLILEERGATRNDLTASLLEQVFENQYIS